MAPGRCRRLIVTKPAEGVTMKNILVLVCLLLLSTAALSQTRSRTTRRGAQAAKPPAQQAGADAKTAGATKIADQIKNLTRFVYLLGGVAKGIESVDESAR